MMLEQQNYQVNAIVSSTGKEMDALLLLPSNPFSLKEVWNMNFSLRMAKDLML